MPGTGGIDELEALKMRIERRLHDLALDLACLDVRQEHLHGEPVTLREEHDVTAIGA
jgi:hypothetical protein